jgi:hypothetical protein
VLCALHAVLCCATLCALDRSTTHDCAAAARALAGVTYDPAVSHYFSPPSDERSQPESDDPPVGSVFPVGSGSTTAAASSSACTGTGGAVGGAGS